MTPKKKRLDVLLVERGLAPTRARGQSFILSGNVFVNGRKVEKAGEAVADDAVIEVKGKDHPYVGRGGIYMRRGSLRSQPRTNRRGSALQGRA